LIERMVMGDGNPALYDSGFYNLGVTLPGNDIGAAGLDPFGNPLNFAREAKNYMWTNYGTAGAPATQTLYSSVGPDGITVNTLSFEVAPGNSVLYNERDAMDGAFKTPSLRNAELTGPYFHTGGYATLEQVVDFYDRGGNSRGDFCANTTGYNNLAPGLLPTGATTNYPSNLPPSIVPLNLDALGPNGASDLVAFLKSLTDERVRWEKAPFDHPALVVPNGHPYNELTVKKNGQSIYATENTLLIPAVGAAGRTKQQGPILPFAAGLQ
jgi:hypothetical protein